MLERLSTDGVPYPVFLISGYHDARTVAHANRFGATVVDKPFDARALAGQILGSIGPTRH